MPRNLHQLPLNEDPQLTDWLLGASGLSPAVFQKMQLEQVKDLIGASRGGAGLFFTPVNEPTTLEQGGLFFTDTLTENIAVACPTTVGNYFRWLNYSTKTVILTGFTHVDSTAVPENKGIGIAAGQSLEGFVNQEGKFKVLSGAYSSAWIPGFEPPGFPFWRIDYNKILSEIQVSFDSNPNQKIVLSGGEVLSFSRSSSLSTAPVGYTYGALNNNLWNEGYIGSDSAAESLFQSYIINFSSAKTIVKVFVGWQSGGYNRPTNIKLYASLYGDSWSLIKEWAGNPLLTSAIQELSV